MRPGPKVLHVTDLQALPARERPAYTVSDVSHYLGTPAATVRAWSQGQTGFKRVFQVERVRSGPLSLSFVNLVEVHVLDALRRYHRLSLPRIRAALRYLGSLYPRSRHPLAELDLRTDGFSLFVNHLSQLVNVTDDGQLAMTILEAYLVRIERDLDHLPIRLFPFTRRRENFVPADEPRIVVIDPEVAFGRPTLAESGTPTDVIAERFRAGESILELAEDYGRTSTEIEEALRCERVA